MRMRSVAKLQEKGRRNAPSLPELLKEAEIVHAGSPGEVDDAVQPVPLDVAQGHVPLSALIIAGTGGVLDGIGEMPEGDASATQHLDGACRPVLGSDHDPYHWRLDVPQRVAQPRQRRLLRHAVTVVVWTRDGDDQQEAQVRDGRRVLNIERWKK